MGIGHWRSQNKFLIPVILPCNTAFEAIMSGRTSTTWEKGTYWNGGETTTIRIPIVLTG
ncbi:MAG: hypothetical protein V7K94_21085 [Nostoc sp.]|uniref:hypothetical protein n=1 Tax=Nostoc sp. TaxID=1180 RepID=UPI002FF4FC3E